jgi:RNA polymerase sigma factor (sigma-70 family)
MAGLPASIVQIRIEEDGMQLDVPPEVIEAARSNDQEAMESLLRMLWPHAYRIARLIIQDDALAEDAAQEASATIYRDLRSLRSVGASRVWLYHVVAREAVRVAKRYKQDQIAASIDSALEIERRLDVLDAVGTLPPVLRAVVVLHYYADLSTGEIGAALQIPGATVRFRLVQARRRLRASLADHGVMQASSQEVRA